MKSDNNRFCFSLSENLKELLIFAENIFTITNKERNAILHARKTILKNNEETWIKKERLFDEGMGANDSAVIA